MYNAQSYVDHMSIEIKGLEFGEGSDLIGQLIMLHLSEAGGLEQLPTSKNLIRVGENVVDC